MPLAIELTRARRNPRELTDLVSAIFNASANDESDWIEWKSSLDLTRKEDQGTIARHILGMANRKPEDATRHAGGCGYVVIGVEPGNCGGVVAVDPAVLGQGIQPYLGSEGPSWSMQYVQFSGSSVLVVIVEPPRAGDRSFPLQKEMPKPQGGTPYLLGTVFVRRPGRTIQAEPGDIRALEDRFAALAQPIALLVEPATAPSVVEIRPPGDATALLDSWEARRRGELLPAQPAERKDQPPRVVSGPAEATLMEQMAAASAAAHGLAGTLDSIMPPDKRTDEEYRAEVERYLGSCRVYYAQLALSRYAASDAALMRLRLANASDRNYTEVQVQIHIAGKVSARDPDEIESPGEEPPAAPRARGARQPIRLFPSPLPYAPQFPLASRPLRANFRISNSDSTTITYDISRVRPEQRINLLPTLLSLTGDGKSRLEATWTVATGNADGLARGTFEVAIGAPVDAVELLPELAS